MGFLDKITKLAEKAADAVVKTSDQLLKPIKRRFDGIVNKTADSLTKAGQKHKNILLILVIKINKS